MAGRRRKRAFKSPKLNLRLTFKKAVVALCGHCPRLGSKKLISFDGSVDNKASISSPLSSAEETNIIALSLATKDFECLLVVVKTCVG